MAFTWCFMTSSFFFQAEDGIRFFPVTGVQTCALPILAHHLLRRHGEEGDEPCALAIVGAWLITFFEPIAAMVKKVMSHAPTMARAATTQAQGSRSEERRVGKETSCRELTAQSSQENAA